MQQFWKEEKNKVMPILVILGADFFIFYLILQESCLTFSLTSMLRAKNADRVIVFFILSCSTQHDELFVLKITS